MLVVCEVNDSYSLDAHQSFLQSQKSKFGNVTRSRGQRSNSNVGAEAYYLCAINDATVLHGVNNVLIENSIGYLPIPRCFLLL